MFSLEHPYSNRIKSEPYFFFQITMKCFFMDIKTVIVFISVFLWIVRTESHNILGIKDIVNEDWTGVYILRSVISL